MGFLIFAFRKISLKREINQKNYRLTCLSADQRRLHNQISVMQQAEASMKNAWASVSDFTLSSAQSLFQVQTQGSQVPVGEALKALQEARTTNDQAKIAEAEKNYQIVFENAKNQNIAATNIFENSKTIALQANQSIENVFAAAEKAQMASLQKQDDQYDIEKESIETQLTLLQEEYTNVKKAEQQAAKDAAPSFGQ